MRDTASERRDFCSAIALDLGLLARLHDREPTAQTLEALRETPTGDWFAIKPPSEFTRCGMGLVQAALEELPNPVGETTCNELAVDYANIYLLHTYRAPPTESPWLDKDQLERQEPMFAIADWYRRYGLSAENRQLRSDDHLVRQLGFLSHLFSLRQPEKNLPEAARFMDAHILKWFGEFAAIVASRCTTPYYAGIVTLTHGYLEDLREMLAVLADAPRPDPEKRQAFVQPHGSEDQAHSERYLPGVSPSW